MKSTTKQITVTAETASLAKVREFVETAVGTADFDEHETSLVTLAIDEAVTSIVHYTAHLGTRDTVTVTIDVTPVLLKATIDEKRTVFDLPPIPNGEMLTYLRNEAAYKMGIFLMRRIFYSD